MPGTRLRGDKQIWRIYVPTELAVEIELLLADPLRQRPTYGARTHLVTFLLQRYLEETKEAAKEKAHDKFRPETYSNQ